jgi:hypothetical protein
LVESLDTYRYFAGGNDDGGNVSDLFTETRDSRGNLNQAGREIANRFTGNNPNNEGGTKVGTTGRLPGVAGTQPANLANGDPVFAVIAYNTNTVQTQTGVSHDSLGGISGQIAGEGQRVQPVSLFIHESTENLEFRRIGRFTITLQNYIDAHFHAQEREAAIRRDVGITGGFAGGVLQSRVPRR